MLKRIVSLSLLLSCSDYNIVKKESTEQLEYGSQEDTNREVEESCIYTDNFTVNHPCIDIIAMVDTSGSMYDTTNNEIHAVQAYLTTFTRERLQIYPNPTMMVISTASEHTNTPVTETTAATAIWVLEPGSGTTEAPLETLLTYVSSEHAAAWMRDQCAVSMMIFSDEDDQSYSALTYDTEGDAAAVDQFIDDLESIYNLETKEISVTAAINPSTEYLCDLIVEENQIGYRAEQLAAYYDGNINDICSADDTWRDPEIPITTEAEETGWRLTYIPEPETIVVDIGGQLATTACTYSDGVVFYPYVKNLAEGTEIRILYNIDKNQYTENECPL